MKSIYFFLFALLLNLSSCNEIESTKPKIVFLSKSIELGVVKSGQKYSGKMTIKNIGVDDLIIKSIKSGCRCTNISITSNIIKHNKEAVLHITYVADSNAENGKFIVPVVIRSNSEKILEEFYIHGTVN